MFAFSRSFSRKKMQKTMSKMEKALSDQEKRQKSLENTMEANEKKTAATVESLLQRFSKMDKEPDNFFAVDCAVACISPHFFYSIFSKLVLFVLS